MVSYVTASQRTDGSGIVDVYYTLTDADGDNCGISVVVSDDGGSNWNITPSALSDDLSNVSPGRRHIIWPSKTDLPGAYGTNYRVKVTADDGVVDGPGGMVWVYINDPGIGGGHEGFNGYMSKYETTNAQYAQYLNSAKAAGQITVYNNSVYASSDTSHSQVYFATFAATLYSQIAYSGGTFIVRSRDGYSMANHPVVQVSWYGATAFCNYYGFCLPTEWEWQAVADYDGTYTYGCGTTINHSKANYGRYNPLGLSSYPYTSPVNHYSSYGYGMNDMAGNVWEWTSSIYSGSYRVIRGGSWYYSDSYCTVSGRYYYYPHQTHFIVGFRVCR